MAAESPVIEAKRRVEYLEIQARKLAGKCLSGRMHSVWTINPYRGCEFGCRYCYARYAHEFMELRDPVLFETRIFAKQFDAVSFRRELARVPRGESLWIGTATDPYQPAERRFEVTRRILDVIAMEKGRSIGITTKSDLVVRDLDLLARVAEQNTIHVHLTITTLDEDLARLIEPLAPRPSLRMKAVQRLTEQGIGCTVLAHPIMPLINDSEASLDALCGAAALAGAVSFSAAPLFLKPCSKQVFLPFVEEHFPHLARRYRERYNRQAYLTGDYPVRLRERVVKLIAKHGLKERGAADLTVVWPAEPQMDLFEERNEPRAANVLTC